MKRQDHAERARASRSHMVRCAIASCLALATIGCVHAGRRDRPDKEAFHLINGRECASHLPCPSGWTCTHRIECIQTRNGRHCSETSDQMCKKSCLSDADCVEGASCKARGESGSYCTEEVVF